MMIVVLKHEWSDTNLFLLLSFFLPQIVKISDKLKTLCFLILHREVSKYKGRILTCKYNQK